jgi:hypothetical protein
MKLRARYEIRQVGFESLDVDERTDRRASRKPTGNFCCELTEISESLPVLGFK